MSRKDGNKIILETLRLMVEEFSDLRFTQLMSSLGFEVKIDGQDAFYKENDEVAAHMQKGLRRMYTGHDCEFWPKICECKVGQDV